VTKTIGIGVVGFGWMGQAHSRAYRDIPVYYQETGFQPRLVAVADNVQERLDLARDNFGYAAGHLDWRELIARDDIDVVDITAPNALHREIVEAIREILVRAVEDPSGVQKVVSESGRAGVQVLHRSSDLTILNVVWGPGMTVMPHNHNIGNYRPGEYWDA
jgi:hypothetical protein